MEVSSRVSAVQPYVKTPSWREMYMILDVYAGPPSYAVYADFDSIVNEHAANYDVLWIFTCFRIQLCG